MSDKKKRVSRLDRFFNEHYYKNLLELCDYNVISGVEKFKDYLELYPEDYTAHCMYASNLIKLRRFDEAEEMLDMAETKYKTNKTYDNEEKEEMFYNNLHFTRIKLLCYQGKYQECINYCRMHKDILLKHEVNFGLTLHYCIMQLDNSYGEKYKTANDGYLYKQIMDYSYDEFRKHIEKHLVDYKPKEDEEITSFFFKGFPIDRVLEEIKDHIPNTERSYCNGFFDDYYYFKYDGCGRCVTDKDRKNSKDKKYKSKLLVADYFKVTTFHDSPNIITISPCYDNQGLSYVDLNHIKEEEEPKVLKKSAIKTFIEKWY